MKLYRVLGRSPDNLDCNSTLLIATNAKTFSEGIICGGDKVVSLLILQGEKVPYVSLKYGISLFDDFSTITSTFIKQTPVNLILARDTAVAITKKKGTNYFGFRWSFDNSFSQNGGKFWSGPWMEANHDGYIVGHLEKIKNQGNPLPIIFGFEYWFHDEYDEPIHPQDGEDVPLYVPCRSTVNFGVSHNSSDKTIYDGVMKALWDRLETGYCRRAVYLG
ncbi:hypothetical protein [Cohnella fermenti]|uniref:Uncharacterized protein n=1 Tax=Cohnella fermenti TaxID=2565925 RepID=A0A4S4BXL5_9BACL|nr:hypothetical protein [Cohnella fermenti]THF79447.1 hypothetical protein E6C55_11695 [Cohnella fermenti]